MRNSAHDGASKCKVPKSQLKALQDYLISP